MVRVAGKEDLRCSGKRQFCSFFSAFEIKKGRKADCMKLGESKLGTGLQDR